MRHITLVALLAFMAAPAMAQHDPFNDPNYPGVQEDQKPPEAPPPATEQPKPVAKKHGLVLHPELFATFGRSYFEDVLLDDGEPPGGFTVSMTYQFGFGSGRWTTCDPDTDRECTEKNAPRIALSGIGVAWAPNGGVGWGIQFPLVTLRVVRNAWLASAVTVWPNAPDWRRNATLTVGVAIALTPGR